MLFLLLAGVAAGKPWNACTADKRSFKFCDEALPLEERREAGSQLAAAPIPATYHKRAGLKCVVRQW